MSAAISAMITGTLTKDAEAKISGGGKEYVQLVIRTPGEPAQFVRTALFGDDCEGALTLSKGDAVSVVGNLTVGVWESNGNASPSLSMMGHRCISPAIKKPRKPAHHRSATKPTQASFKAAAEAQSIRTVQTGDLANDLPWNE